MAGNEKTMRYNAKMKLLVRAQGTKNKTTKKHRKNIGHYNFIINVHLFKDVRSLTRRQRSKAKGCNMCARTKHFTLTVISKPCYSKPWLDTYNPIGKYDRQNFKNPQNLLLL